MCYFAGGALVVFVATMDWRIYVPAFVVVAVTAVTSALILARQLPVWSIVDGLRLRSRLNVKYGVQDHEVSATTDMALRALDVSLRAFNDRGELQSCVYWSKLVPKRAGEVVSASGGLYELLEPGGLSSHMNPVVRTVTIPNTFGPLGPTRCRNFEWLRRCTLLQLHHFLTT